MPFESDSQRRAFFALMQNKKEGHDFKASAQTHKNYHQYYKEEKKNYEKDAEFRGTSPHRSEQWAKFRVIQANKIGMI